MTNLLGKCNGLIVIWEAKEDKVRRNPVGTRSLEGLGALGRLGLESIAICVFQLYSLMDHFTA